MARIGMFCLPMQSHLNLFLVLGAALRELGHEPVFFSVPTNAERIGEAAFEAHLMEPEDLPPGTLDAMLRNLGSPGEGDPLRAGARFEYLRCASILQKAPFLVKKSRLDCMVVDQAEACSGSVAEAAGLPWVNVCNSLPFNSEPAVPPFYTHWSYADGWGALTRNRLAYAFISRAMGPALALINRYRKDWGLQAKSGLAQTFSTFAQISQQVPEFDFPRRHLPQCFHYVGPIRAPQPRHVDFPWERLDGRPLIYASLGTVVNRNDSLYRTIIEACSTLPCQLVLSLGGAHTSQLDRNSPGNPIVVDFAPQSELLRKASLAITHAGLNSVLESLREGVPMVAVPITFDQPGIAARIRWTGTGDFLPARQCNAKRLRTLLLRVLEEPSYKQAARRLQQAFANCDGARLAAAIIDQVVRTRVPVTTLDGLRTAPPDKGADA